MKIKLPQSQRDAIHLMIRLRLHRIDAIPILLDRDEPIRAKAEWQDCCSLIALLDEIGWAQSNPDPSTSVVLTDAILRRTTNLIQSQAMDIFELAAEDRSRINEGETSRLHEETAALTALKAFLKQTPDG